MCWPKNWTEPLSFFIFLLVGTSAIAQTAGSSFADCNILASSPSDPQRQATGVSYDKLNAASAIAACGKATQQNPNNGQLYFQYGRALEKGNRLADAIDAYQKGAALNNAGALNNLGELYRDGKGFQKDLATAEIYFTKAAAQQFPEAVASLAQLQRTRPAQQANYNVQTLVYSHGRYVGSVLNGKANGRGTYTSKASGTSYTGNFVSDTFSGEGTMLWTNGFKYVGEWQNDVGVQGTMFYPNGANMPGVVNQLIFTPL